MNQQLPPPGTFSGPPPAGIQPGMNQGPPQQMMAPWMQPPPMQQPPQMQPPMTQPPMLQPPPMQPPQMQPPPMNFNNFQDLTDLPLTVKFPMLGATPDINIPIGVLVSQSKLLNARSYEEINPSMFGQLEEVSEYDIRHQVERFLNGETVLTEKQLELPKPKIVKKSKSYDSSDSESDSSDSSRSRSRSPRRNRSRSRSSRRSSRSPPARRSRSPPRREPPKLGHLDGSGFGGETHMGLGSNASTSADPFDAYRQSRSQKYQDRIVTRERGSGKSDSLCYACGEPGHFARDCKKFLT